MGEGHSLIEKGNEMAKSILDWIIASEEVMTKSRFKDIRNNGTEEELAEAVQQMLEAGGYENMED